MSWVFWCSFFVSQIKSFFIRALHCLASLRRGNISRKKNAASRKQKCGNQCFAVTGELVFLGSGKDRKSKWQFVSSTVVFVLCCIIQHCFVLYYIFGSVFILYCFFSVLFLLYYFIFSVQYCISGLYLYCFSLLYLFCVVLYFVLHVFYCIFGIVCVLYYSFLIQFVLHLFCTAFVLSRMLLLLMQKIGLTIFNLQWKEIRRKGPNGIFITAVVFFN